ncbi:Reverse transcriptase domain and Integrase,catalytic core domain and Ribonuclease H-like domain-containing protein [Strongyloides ratti]|uniref:RNA-directed DNA polymerase n=1 Tax=Strongyloides ratti TaxID=34506 RepID=A0A090MQK3_STRRB|nr:Reverse transcriptase domain and Integrase,catalytic core domain and Ribonuclease H-like domain-containing protein [Strongyloides ratti]CEF60453.1 Reverse transcriptase domain and Integrase,catalytic core domain and Ribonuclease H-like domain-containing protein [Strongyloides ratti]
MSLYIISFKYGIIILLYITFILCQDKILFKSISMLENPFEKFPIKYNVSSDKSDIVLVKCPNNEYKHNETDDTFESEQKINLMSSNAVFKTLKTEWFAISNNYLSLNKTPFSCGVIKLKKFPQLSISWNAFVTWPKILNPPNNSSILDIRKKINDEWYNKSEIFVKKINGTMLNFKINKEIEFMILNISEVVENSRVLEVDKNISSKNQEYSNDEILSMLMDKNPDVMEAISFGKNDIGKFKENVEEFEIDWKKASTEFIPYKFPEKLRDEAEKLIQELLETKTIIQGPAKLLHNVICVRKRNGELRACVDMRYSNKYMDKCQFPIPHLEQFLYKTRGFKYYSVLDLPSAYHQFYLAENQRNLLGIFFRGKTYAYQTLPQGCKNSPMFMQMKLSSLLDEDIIAWYYDDGIICSNNFEEHLEKLSIVLKKMVSVGLKISHSKSIFCAKSVDFLGNHLAEGLVITDGAKRTINSIKEPKTVSDVRALLGNLGFYSKYVPNYAKILYPVTQLLKKDVSFNWNTDCVEALKKIKKLVCSDVVLSRIQLNLPLIIQSDACERGYGVAVFQESSEGIRKPVLFWSMKRPHAIKYRNSVYLEGHSIICFIRKHYHLLLGMEILIETDNKPLSQAMTNQSLHPQLSAWAQELSFFQIVWKYIPKRENDIADILSRVEKSNEPTLEPNEVESLSLIQGGVSMLERVDDEVGLEVDGKNASELHGYESLNVILERNMKDELNVMNSSNDVFKEGKNSKFLLNENEEMKLLGNRNGFVGSITAIELKEQQRKWVDKHKPNNLVKRKNSDYWGIIDKEGKWIPLLTEELIDREARLLHSFGHFNWKKIAEIIKHRAYHPNLFKVVEMAVKNCEVCQKCNVKCKKIIKTNWCSYMLPRENYSADIMGPREGKYIIHIIDAATSFWMCAIISNCDGERIMMEVLKLCWRYGFPSTWRTDNAPYWNLTSKKLKECNCEVQTSNAYHHEGNTLAENAIGNLQHIMRKLLTEQIKNVQSIPLPLEEIVEWSVIFHNGVGIEGESPSELFLGHKLRIPSIFEEHSLNEVGTDMSRDVELLRLECLSKRSSKNMLNKIDRESKLSSKNGNMERVTQLSENYKNMNNNGSYLDELSGEKEIVRETVERGTSPMLENNKDSNEFFKVGDQVLASANWKKLQAKWEGPYLIQEINGSTAILTRPLIRGKRGRPPKTVVSRNLVQLKKFQEGDMF